MDRTQSTRTTSGSESKENERAEAKAREDALQQPSFENAETIVDEKEQTIDSAGHRRSLKFFAYFETPIWVIGSWEVVLQTSQQWLPRSLVLRSVLSQV